MDKKSFFGVENIWEEFLSLFLRQAIVNSPNKELFIRSLLYSLDNYDHMYGIDVSDVINFFKDYRSVKISYKEFSAQEGLINLEKVRQSLSLYTPLYVHFESNHSIGKLCPVFTMFDMNQILSSWITRDPSRDILISLVFSPSPDKMLKLWQIYPDKPNNSYKQKVTQ